MGRRTKLAVALTALTTMVATLGGVASAQSEEPAVVTVFHAVPAEDGFPADVYLNGDLVIDGFVFETSSESFELAPGDATLEIYAEGADPDQETPAVTTTVSFEPGRNYSVVAQLAEGSPVITLYVNDTSGVGAGEARVTLRQTSDIDSIDATIGEAEFVGLAPTEEASAVVTPGELPLTLRNQVGATFFTHNVDVASGALTILYAVGDSIDGTFDLLVQEIPISQVAPAGVPTGNGGDKASAPDPRVGLTLMGIVGVALLGHRRLT